MEAWIISFQRDSTKSSIVTWSNDSLIPRARSINFTHVERKGKIAFSRSSSLFLSLLLPGTGVFKVEITRVQNTINTVAERPFYTGGTLE